MININLCIINDYISMIYILYFCGMLVMLDMLIICIVLNI